MTPTQRGRISPMLKQGLGAEDIAMILGVEYHEVLRVINDFRRRGMIYDICGTSRMRTERVLRIMGGPVGGVA